MRRRFAPAGRAGRRALLSHRPFHLRAPFDRGPLSAERVVGATEVKESKVVTYRHCGRSEAIHLSTSKFGRPVRNAGRVAFREAERRKRDEIGKRAVAEPWIASLRSGSGPRASRNTAAARSPHTSPAMTVGAADVAR